VAPKIATPCFFCNIFSTEQEKMGGDISKQNCDEFESKVSDLWSEFFAAFYRDRSGSVTDAGEEMDAVCSAMADLLVEEAEKIGEEKTKNFVNLCVANIQRSQSLAQQDFLTCRLRMNFMGWWLQHGELEAPASEVAKLFNSWKSMADYTFKFAKDDREQDTVLFFASDMEVSNAYSGKQLYRTQNEDENTFMLCG
jgi:hypothetical protein